MSPAIWPRVILIVSAAVIFNGGTTALTAIDIASLPQLTRDEIIASAKKLANHKWTCHAANLKAPCIKNYDTNWKAEQQITGLPYGWGDMDSVETFEKKIATGYGAGAHSRHGISKCTAGIDCSGFVAFCWGLKSHAYSTRNLRDIAGASRGNVFTDMLPGDALVKPGDHVVLFAGYNPDGTPNIYEASGSASRVIYHKVPWSRLVTYRLLVYKGIRD